MAPSPARWGSSTDSIGHWLFAERQIHRIYSSDHACRMQTILLEPFTCKRVHATLHSLIFCLVLMLIFHNVQARFRQVVDVVRSCAAPRSLQQRVKNRGLCGWYMPVSRSKRSPIQCAATNLSVSPQAEIAAAAVCCHRPRQGTSVRSTIPIRCGLGRLALNNCLASVATAGAAQQ